jgi:hypothetical protein
MFVLTHKGNTEMIKFNALLADASLPDPETLNSPSSVHPDPLIDRGGQITVYIGTALLVVGIAAAVGFFSRRVEHALFTALGLSLCVVAFFVFTR